MATVVNPFADVWTPARLNPSLWLDATDPSTIVQSAGAVSEWKDKSKLGNHMLQATAVKQPTTGSRTLNGNNVLDFDPGAGDGEYMNAASITALPDSTYDIFFVYKKDRTSEADYLFTFDGAAGDQLRGNRFADVSFDGGLGGTSFNTGGVASDTDPHILNMRLDGVNGAYLFADGVQVDSDLAAPVSGTINDYLRIAANAFGGDTLDGYIGEVLVFPYLSDANRQLVEAYLAWKWGGA